jgi:hemerythrin superfamily protein
MHHPRSKEIPMPNRIESIMAKGAGKVKGVKARLEGLVGVFRTLAEQHGEVKVLLKHLQDDPDRRSQLWPEIRRELLSHERGELREVYPVMREHPQLMELALHHDEEAADLENLIDDIEAAGDVDWQPLYDQLVDMVNHHAQEEEKHIFPKAQKVIGDKLTEELDARFLAAKRQIALAV